MGCCICTDAEGEWHEFRGRLRVLKGNGTIELGGKGRKKTFFGQIFRFQKKFFGSDHPKKWRFWEVLGPTPLAQNRSRDLPLSSKPVLLRRYGSMAPQNRPFRGFKAQKFDVVGSVALVLDETGTAKSELLVLG